MKKFINFKTILVLVLILLFSNSFTIAVQFLKGNLLDKAIVGGIDAILIAGLLLLIAILLQILLTYFDFITENKLVTDSIKNVKGKLFDKIICMKFKDFNSTSQSEYISKYTSEIQVLENNYFRSFAMLLVFGFTVIFVSIALFWLNIGLAIITILLLTMPLYVPKIAEKRLKRAQNNSVESTNKFIRYITDVFKGFEVIKNYNIEKIISGKFRAQNNATIYNYRKNLNTQSETRTISMFMSYFSYFVVVAYSAYLVSTKTFSIGDFFIAIGLVEQLSHPIIATAGCIQNIVSVKKLNITLTEFIEDKNQDNLTPLNHFEDKVVFENVSFSYDENELLKNVNLEFKKNSKYLIKGASGSGKTTLINLLLKYQDTYSGNILIDDTDIKNIDTTLGYISIARQDNFLFDDTLRNNLGLYKDVSDDEIIKILKMVQLDKYASKDFLDIQLGNEGISLSGGEQKRLTLARALLHKKDILILDEPLANLDKIVVEKLEKELLNMDNITVIMISHIISEVNESKFDQIYTV